MAGRRCMKHMIVLAHECCMKETQMEPGLIATKLKTDISTALRNTTESYVRLRVMKAMMLVREVDDLTGLIGSGIRDTPGVLVNGG